MPGVGTAWERTPLIRSWDLPPRAMSLANTALQRNSALASLFYCVLESTTVSNPKPEAWVTQFRDASLPGNRRTKGAGETAQEVKCLPCKHEDPSFHSQPL